MLHDRYGFYLIEAEPLRREELVPDDICWDEVAGAFARAEDRGERLIVLDNFPFTRRQARLLVEHIRTVRPDRVIWVDLLATAGICEVRLCQEIPGHMDWAKMSSVSRCHHLYRLHSAEVRKYLRKKLPNSVRTTLQAGRTLAEVQSCLISHLQGISTFPP